MTRQRRRTLAAGIVLAAIATLIGAWATDDGSQAAATRAGAIAMPDFTAPPAAPIGDGTAILTRPLFSPDRRPIAAPQTAAVQAASPASRLIAVAIGPDRSAAILQLTSGKTAVLLQGEQIDGWVLSAVGADHVLLRSDQRQVALALPVRSSAAARGAGQISSQQ